MLRTTREIVWTVAGVLVIAAAGSVIFGVALMDHFASQVVTTEKQSLKERFEQARAERAKATAQIVEVVKARPAPQAPEAPPKPAPPQPKRFPVDAEFMARTGPNHSYQIWARGPRLEPYEASHDLARSQAGEAIEQQEFETYRRWHAMFRQRAMDLPNPGRAMHSGHTFRQNEQNLFYHQAGPDARSGGRVGP